MTNIPTSLGQNTLHHLFGTKPAQMVVVVIEQATFRFCDHTGVGVAQGFGAIEKTEQPRLNQGRKGRVKNCTVACMVAPNGARV